MNKRILLVEDNESDERLAVLAFKRADAGCEVAVARDGVDALAYLLSPPADQELPDLVLLDLQLPRVGGLEVLRRVRANERTRLLPVVILTSSNEPEDLLNGYASGANAYIRKPVDFNDFAQAAKSISHFWLRLNELPR